MQVPPPFNPAPPQQATYNPTIPLAPAELQTLQAQQAPVTSQAKPAGRIFLAALLLGWAFDTLFVGSSIGISAPIFAGLLVATLFAIGRLEDVRPVRENLWLHAALLFFSLMLFVRASGFLTFLNVNIVFLLLLLIAHYHGGGLIRRGGLVAYLIVPMASAGHACLLALVHIAPTMRLWRGKRTRRFRVGAVARGSILALPVLVVFGALLMSADMVFANLVGSIFDLSFLTDTQIIWHGTIILVVAWLLAGGLLYAVRPSTERGRSWEEASTEAGTAGLRLLAMAEASTVLVLVNCLFLVFGAIQFAYLFGGEGNIGISGFTYAEYARRGFFELVAVAAMTLGLILLFHYIVPRITPREKLNFNLLCTLMVGLVLVLLASAFRRMQIYETAYGYTELRLCVYVAMIWLAALLGWQLVVLWLEPDRFALGAFLTVLGFVATLNILNPDSFVTARNFEHYKATGKIDMYYLLRMSEDAVPDLVAGLKTLPPSESNDLRENLLERRADLYSKVDRQNWQEFHLSRTLALHALGNADLADHSLAPLVPNGPSTNTK